jgi:hypothetical protein
VPPTKRLLGRRSLNSPSRWLPRPSLENLSLGMHGTWFYCENHKPNLPPFIGRLPKFQGTWSEEPTPLELPQVAALTNKVNSLKEKGLTGVYVDAHWLSHRVQPLKKQVYLVWEYSGSQDPTQETQEKISLELILKHLGEIFQDISSWPTDE